MPHRVRRTIKRDGHADAVVHPARQYATSLDALAAILDDVGDLIVANVHLPGNIKIKINKDERTVTVIASDGSRSAEYELTAV